MSLRVCLLVVLFVYTIYLYYFTRCMPSFSPTFRVFLFNQLCSAFFEALLCTHIYNWREFSKSSCQSDFSFATTGGFHWRFYCQGWGGGEIVERISWEGGRNESRTGKLGCMLQGLLNYNLCILFFVLNYFAFVLLCCGCGFVYTSFL